MKTANLRRSSNRPFLLEVQHVLSREGMGGRDKRLHCVLDWAYMGDSFVLKQMTATVWFSTAKGRRYLSKSAAIRAETNAIIFARYPSESPDYDNGHMTYQGWNIAEDEPERYSKMFRRLRRIVAKSIEAA